jgi:acyl-CoA thioesterase I
MSCGTPEPKKEAIASKKEIQNKVDNKKNNQPTILFFGNSLTAGYGIDPDLAFPNLIQKRLDSLGYNYQVVNAGLSGETTSGGNTRIDWILKQKIDVFVLELGGNDGLRGIGTEESAKNLQSIIDKVKKTYPSAQIILAGMEVPPNMGQDYAQAFRKMYKDLTEKNKVLLIPFLLENVGGIPELNLPDGIHPTPEGHKMVMETVWTYLQKAIEK